jgi:hypothetical protein
MLFGRDPQEGRAGAGATIIHGVPNSSEHIPNASEKKVGVNGWLTDPPRDKASNTRFASAALGAS